MHNPFLGQGSIEQRTLDALLRIEALLIAHFAPVEDAVVDGLELSDVITNISPQKTPFMEAGAGALLRVTAPPQPKGKGKRK